MGVRARNVGKHDDVSQPGDFCFTVQNGVEGCAGLIYLCPCGCGIEGALTFRKGVNEDKHPAWDWDGNQAAPTLSPSIRRTVGCRWHGHLRKGVWESC